MSPFGNIHETEPNHRVVRFVIQNLVEIANNCQNQILHIPIQVLKCKLEQRAVCSELILRDLPPKCLTVSIQLPVWYKYYKRKLQDQAIPNQIVWQHGKTSGEVWSGGEFIFTFPKARKFGLPNSHTHHNSLSQDRTKALTYVWLGHKGWATNCACSQLRKSSDVRKKIAKYKERLSATNLPLLDRFFGQKWRRHWEDHKEIGDRESSI